MAITSRLCLTLAIALAVVGTFPHNVHALAAEGAPVPPTADVADDTFDYEQYQSPPIWTHAQPIDHNNVHIMDTQPGDDGYIPIQYRPGGARGGDNDGHHGRRRRSFEKRIQHKRAVIYDDDAHLSLLQDVEFGAVVDTDLPVIEFEKRSSFVKRALVDDEGEVQEQEEEEKEEEDAEGYDGVDETFEFDGDVEVGGKFNRIFEGQDVVIDNDFENEEEEEEDEDEGEEGEYDEDEERRLDSEAGLQDWVEEMKSEEYFDLAGHPDGQDEEEEGEGGVHAYDEDEPSPSEEEIFAASWTH
ncbi:MAG: hypothetical protein BYD32DRAFT_411418 [Podila humilis]|nr:MAG: hypothetical protein BYD32DRAFT_411418 [Podila humilis]